MFARLLKTASPWEDFEEGRRSWSSFSPREQQALVERYSDKVRYLAQQQKRRVPASVDLEELMSAGMLGLLEALQKFDPRTSASFRTFAESRIQGAMLDDLRGRDPLSRGARAAVKKIERVLDEYETRMGRRPTEREIARAAKLSLDEVRAGLQAMERQTAVDMDLFAESLSDDARESGGTPCTSAMRSEAVRIVKAILGELSDREKFILSMSFVEDCTLREIAAAMKVSEGRVSQLRTQALRRAHGLYMARYGR